MKHFKLTENTKINKFGVELFQIECIIDFKHANKGDLGGWIEEESNLYGNAWVYGDAMVYGNARVSKKVFTLNFVYLLTLTDNHISYGCIQKTVKEWQKWLKSDKVIETERNTDRFKLIEMSLKLAIEQHKQSENE